MNAARLTEASPVIASRGIERPWGMQEHYVFDRDGKSIKFGAPSNSGATR